jgi:hypothetical protein
MDTKIKVSSNETSSRGYELMLSVRSSGMFTTKGTSCGLSWGILRLSRIYALTTMEPNS